MIDKLISIYEDFFFLIPAKGIWNFIMTINDHVIVKFLTIVFIVFFYGFIIYAIIAFISGLFEIRAKVYEEKHIDEINEKIRAEALEKMVNARIETTNNFMSNENKQIDLSDKSNKALLEGLTEELSKMSPEEREITIAALFGGK